MKRRDLHSGETEKHDRRTFLKKSVALGIGASVFPYVIPARALGLDGHVAPSNRIVMGCIGTGRQGTANLEQFLPFKELQFVGVCDVDRKHREGAISKINATYENTDCAGYNDFRDLLLRDDLDALSIALPDHWHAIPVIEAAKRGLHMYAEKPLALTIEQGRIMSDTVKRYGVVWQTGSWQRSKENFRRACELVRSGRIGEVHTVEVGLPTGHTIETQPEMPIPEGFDYDRWLGPAPIAPYTEKRCHWFFRSIFDYSGGQLTDWAAHHCDIANWGMGTEYTGPVEIEGSAVYPKDGLFDVATNYRYYARYAPGASPVAPNGFTMWVSDSLPMGTKFVGTQGSIFVTRGKHKTDPKSLWDSEIGDQEVRLYQSRNHGRNFIDCVYSHAETVAPIEPAHRAISIGHLGNIAMKLGRKVRWDPAAEAFVNDTEADRLIGRAMRGNWHL